VPKVRPLAVVAAALLSLASPLHAARRPAPSAFTLFEMSFGQLEGNRVYCGFRATGEFCVDVTGSPVLGGGSWPRGSANAYIFNSGLQIAALVPANAGFAWAGDTVGSWFMDTRGDQQSGTAVTSIFDSRHQEWYQPRRDFADWPSAAFVRDTALFATALIGREAVSNHDTWVRYWDGEPDQTAGRGHPMGVLVEQRTLQWNYPNGNDDIVYRIYRIINVTASDPAAYAGLAALGYTATDIADLAALGAQYRSDMQRAFGVTIPAAGYPFTQTFLSWSTDWDIGTVVGDNYSTAVLPFGVASGYVGDFEEPFWSYPADIHAPPLAAAPGFAGQAFLRTPGGPPETRGIHIWSNTTGGGAMPDAVGIGQLYRYMAGTVNPAFGDNDCGVANPQQRHVCTQVQVWQDTRGFMSSGPFTLAPGEAATLVMALVMAAPVQAAIAPYVGTNSPGLEPGIPPGPAGLATGTPSYDTVRVIDRAMGWVSHADVNGDGLIAMNEVQTTPRSLLWKTQLAEAVVASRFQLPEPPAEPDFFVVPGDGQATVVWRPSATEVMGDPYFDVAANPATPLYDPNYRRFDVEGYRVWRGTSPASMQLVAQFDYKQTSIVDYTALVTATYSYPVRGTQCAPELGLLTDCGTLPDTIPLANDLVQVRSGERGLLANGALTVFRADTAFGGRGLPRLTDGGVPFAFIDTTVRNGQTYYYAVTAFDVNSFQSAPSSMESARTPKAVRPRAASGQIAGGAVAVQLLGGDGAVLTDSVMPALDPATGRFAGPMPRTNGLTLALRAFLPQLVGGDTLFVALDSIVPGSALTNPAPARYHLRHWRSGGTPAPLVVGLLPWAFDAGQERGTTVSLDVPLDSAAVARFGPVAGFSIPADLTLRSGGIFGLTQKGRAYIQAQAGPNNGARWWLGTGNENVTDPNGITCGTQAPFTSGCVLADLSRNAGQIPGVGVFGIQSYLTAGATTPIRDLEGITSTVYRAADMRVYWGSNGTVDSVVDVTHRVRVPFRPVLRASWGILNAASFTSTTASSTADQRNNILTWSDILCVAPAPAMLDRCGGTLQTPAVLMSQAQLDSVGFASSGYANTQFLAANGRGFIFYLNGTFTMFRLNALPAAGTVWSARFYAGTIAGTVGSYEMRPAIRPAAVPGLVARLALTPATFDPSVTTAGDLARVHTVPDPYYVSHSLETAENRQILRFVNVPAQAVIRIYSTSGILVRILTNNDVTGGGEMEWDVRNRTGTRVASGVYFWHLETPDGRKRIGRFAVVNGAR
jgi:hypothetical protein